MSSLKLRHHQKKAIPVSIIQGTRWPGSGLKLWAVSIEMALFTASEALRSPSGGSSAVRSF
ncbi:hypothetical protein T05_2411 [Trichinella murrelli]|uniref:Uncharacterized protein n=1 Tax=Trichinella murrelli TaxID=144512 RepID=A0A0V0THD4_9BILA|nr:hypothetical protein T05_2411 [Trichinella murrelli]